MAYRDLKDPRNATAKHNWYLKNKERVKKAARDSEASRMRFVRAVKSYPCEDCNLIWPYYVMQFDHRDPSKKVGHIAKIAKSRSWNDLIDEIMKCDTVCGNCHAIRTHS